LQNTRIIVPRELSNVFSLSENIVRTIEPDSEAVVYLQPRGSVDSIIKQIRNDYSGEIVVVSQQGTKTIPVNLTWKHITSEHFVIYARDNAEEILKAMQVINFLERNYGKVANMVGESNTKTVIYMSSSIDEIKMLGDALAPSNFGYNEEIGFVWSDDEGLNAIALREVAYRTMMQNTVYFTKQKLMQDKGNWVMDGIANYVTGRIVGEEGMIKNQLSAFTDKPVSFEWYGSPTLGQYGATYTLFSYLAEKYGDGIIDKTLTYMNSVQLSNHRCDTLEQCALLRAVYDANGMNINDKRHELNFAAIVNEWKDDVQQKYNINKMN